MRWLRSISSAPLEGVVEKLAEVNQKTGMPLRLRVQIELQAATKWVQIKEVTHVFRAPSDETTTSNTSPVDSSVDETSPTPAEVAAQVCEAQKVARRRILEQEQARERERLRQTERFAQRERERQMEVKRREALAKAADVATARRAAAKAEAEAAYAADPTAPLVVARVSPLLNGGASLLSEHASSSRSVAAAPLVPFRGPGLLGGSLWIFNHALPCGDMPTTTAASTTDWVATCWSNTPSAFPGSERTASRLRSQRTAAAAAAAAATATAGATTAGALRKLWKRAKTRRSSWRSGGAGGGWRQLSMQLATGAPRCARWPTPGMPPGYWP